MAMQDIAAPEDVAQSHAAGKEGTIEAKKWMMRASKNVNTPVGILSWINESWTSLVDLLKVAFFFYFCVLVFTNILSSER